MSRKESNQFDRDCQICGGKIWGKGVKVLLEGAKIVVCQSCAQDGKIVHEQKKRAYRTTSSPKGSTQTRKRYIPEKKEDNLEIVSDFAKRIRNARQSRGLNQDQFAQKLNEKPSLLRRIEANKVKPTIKLANKIQQVYGIKLIKQIDTVEATELSSKYMKKSVGSSLGDIAFIKKKKDY
jgi:putative transcription factor